MTRARSSTHSVLRFGALVLVTGCAGLSRAVPEPGTEATRASGDSNQDGVRVRPTASAEVVTASPLATPFLVASPTSDTLAGIFFQVDDSDAGGTGDNASPRPVARPIPDADAEEMLRRAAGSLPPSPAVQAFQFPERSLPAPRPGPEATGTLSASDSRLPAPAIDEPGPPRIVFTGPRGEAAVTSQVIVLFSRPMVSLDRLDEVPAGLDLEPARSGNWRWLDPSTLVYDVVGGLPRGIVYTVEVPAGIVAPNGDVLAEGVRWSFTTPPPAIVRVTHVRDTDPTQPVIAASFDQNVDPESVLPYLSLEIDGRDYPIALVPDAERDTIPALESLASAPARLVVIRPTSRLAAGDPATDWAGVLRLAVGAPSDQGPVRTAKAADREFSIRKGLRVVAHGCGRAPRCAPGTAWTIQFSQPLRRQAINEQWVRIEPALPGATFET